VRIGNKNHYYQDLNSGHLISGFEKVKKGEKMRIKTLLLGCFTLLFMLGSVILYQSHNSAEKALSKIAGADCGPCLTIPFYECGYDGGMGSCVWEEGPPAGCGPSGGGSCGVDCPSSANHQGCSGIIGSCTMQAVNCAQEIRPKCIYQAYPAGCRCNDDDGTPLGTYCPRADC
jgi:hypothetical protein